MDNIMSNCIDFKINRHDYIVHCISAETVFDESEKDSYASTNEG